jgi:hypothetical protein
MSEISELIPCNNPAQPVCRNYVNKKCRKGINCRFYHPIKITPEIIASVTRKIGYCYCGSPQKCIINKKKYVPGGDTNIFFVICSRTKKSIKKCN